MLRIDIIHTKTCDILLEEYFCFGCSWFPPPPTLWGERHNLSLIILGGDFTLYLSLGGLCMMGGGTVMMGGASIFRAENICMHNIFTDYLYVNT